MILNDLPMWIKKRASLLQRYKSTRRTHTNNHSCDNTFEGARKKVGAYRLMKVAEEMKKWCNHPSYCSGRHFQSVFQFTVNEIFSSSSLFCCQCLSYPLSAASSFIPLQLLLSEPDWLVCINSLQMQKPRTCACAGIVVYACVNVHTFCVPNGLQPCMQICECVLQRDAQWHLLNPLVLHFSTAA